MEFPLRAAVAVAFFAALSAAAAVNVSRFDELFEASWATDHMLHDGELFRLKLDHLSGNPSNSRFLNSSKQYSFISRLNDVQERDSRPRQRYLYGKVTAEIKLVSGDSAGTVTAFYMSSGGSNHNEFDFEFLGNTTGEPYLVQTNVYVNGIGNREQRMDLWFDPAVGFHSYSILWNQRQVVFLVDDTPIRVFRNMEAKGVAFPGYQAMGVYSSLWNADDWATQGGRIKTNWSHAPFIVSYRGLKLDGCEVATGAAAQNELRRCRGRERGKEGRYWWKAPEMEELSVHQSHQLMWVRTKHLVYDYCYDKTRFSTVPPECAD